jgi:hypothetical protein
MFTQHADNCAWERSTTNNTSTTASMQWKHPALPAKKKFKVTPSSRKVMLTVFWDHEGILLTAFQPQGDARFVSGW